MSKILISILAATGLASCAPSGSADSASSGKTLDAALAGRTAGADVSCVNLQNLGDNEGLADGSILFKGKTRRATVYVNRPPGGCPSLTTSRALRTRTTSSQLCSGDIVAVFDPSSGFDYGTCGLGPFTPYSKS